MIPVSAVMIAYENEKSSLTRLRRDLLPALKRLVVKELIVIDNSAQPLNRLAEALRRCGGRYYWNNGDNLLYGPSMNMAAKLARHPYLLYVCSNHGESRDPTWATDLLAAVDYAQVAMAGTLWPSGDPTAVGFPDDLPHHHVQGGVFAARRDVLLQHPWPEGEYAHYGADLVVCFQLMAAGYAIVDVPTVRSTWREHPGEGDWKYVHVGGVDAP
jgi:GT2 family glycosyltransferase